MFKLLTIGAIAAFACLAPSAVSADTVNFDATLSGGSEVPPTDTDASGNAIFILSGDQTTLSFEITFAGFTSPEIGAHIHNAATGFNGPVVLPLPAGSPKIGTWDIPPAMVTELMSGNLYVNIHSETFSSGEIRGQIMKSSSVPTEETTWAEIKTVF